ncbi:hypothetical protein lerEdw1_014294, partial [Lerista edwardsae]
NFIMATGPVRMAPGTVVFIPPNGTNTIQEGQGFPCTVLQPPTMLQYVGQQLGSPGLEPLQTPPVGLLEKLRKLETKTLGAIQIMMGLIHVGLGGVSIFAYYGPTAAIGGYPFWGGAFVSTWFDFEIESQFPVPVALSLGLEAHCSTVDFLCPENGWLLSQPISLATSL